jgi:hypothetical protein
MEPLLPLYTFMVCTGTTLHSPQFKNLEKYVTFRASNGDNTGYSAVQCDMAHLILEK